MPSRTKSAPVRLYANTFGFGSHVGPRSVMMSVDSDADAEDGGVQSVLAEPNESVDAAPEGEAADKTWITVISEVGQTIEISAQTTTGHRSPLDESGDTQQDTSQPAFILTSSTNSYPDVTGSPTSLAPDNACPVLSSTFPAEELDNEEPSAEALPIPLGRMPHWSATPLSPVPERGSEVRTEGSQSVQPIASSRPPMLPPDEMVIGAPPRSPIQFPGTTGQGLGFSAPSGQERREAGWSSPSSISLDLADRSQSLDKPLPPLPREPPLRFPDSPVLSFLTVQPRGTLPATDGNDSFKIPPLPLNDSGDADDASRRVLVSDGPSSSPEFLCGPSLLQPLGTIDSAPPPIQVAQSRSPTTSPSKPQSERPLQPGCTCTGEALCSTCANRMMDEFGLSIHVDRASWDEATISPLKSFSQSPTNGTQQPTYDTSLLPDVGEHAQIRAAPVSVATRVRGA